MIGKKEVKKIVDLALKYSDADQIGVLILNHEQALTRFANNHIHQNVKESDSTVSIQVVFGKKIGFASTNSLVPQKIRETVKWAEEIARFQRENRDFVSLPKVKKSEYRNVETFSKQTARFSNSDRAQAVAEIVDVAKEYSLTAFGSVSNGAAEVCVSNSLGTFAYAICDDLFCNIVMAGKNSTGYTQSGTRNIDEIDFRSLAETSAEKAIMSADPIKIAPGEYTTIFEPLAASEFLDFLGNYAFNGRIFEEGRSYLSGKLGSKIVDDKIAITDDPYRKKGFAFPFDFEGEPKKKLVLIDRGIAKNVVYDSLTASKSGKKSTGHALTAPNPFGPVPLHMTMKGGNKGFKEMVNETKRGILVTRFHYTNIIDPYKLVFTGMTRDGTFLIENGQITKGIKNLRFTENIISCLNRLDDVSKKSALVAREPGYGSRFATGVIVPSIKIRNFAFTSTTEF